MISEECMARIEDVIDQRIRPVLEGHNGDLQIEGAKDGVLYVSMLGVCGSCGMADVTNEQLIKAEIMDAIPEVQDVILVPHIDLELLAFAQQILQNGGLFVEDKGPAETPGRDGWETGIK